MHVFGGERVWPQIAGAERGVRELRSAKNHYPDGRKGCESFIALAYDISGRL
jgi:hypothetical protein